MGDIPRKSSYEDRLIKSALGGRVTLTVSTELKERVVGLGIGKCICGDEGDGRGGPGVASARSLRQFEEMEVGVALGVSTVEEMEERKATPTAVTEAGGVEAAETEEGEIKLSSVDFSQFNGNQQCHVCRSLN